MNYILALLLSLTCAQAASSALVGGVRRNFDTTGTNTTTSAVTITGTGGTNLNAGTVQATNSVNVGRAGEQGVVQFTSTNSTYTATISLLANGTLVVTNNGVLVATIALSSGYDGSTNKFLSASGSYLEVVSGATINSADNYMPFRFDATTFANSARWTSNNFLQRLSVEYPSATTGSNRVNIVATPGVGSTIAFDVDDVELSYLQPAAPAQAIPYLFDTKEAVTNNLFQLNVKGTNQFSVRQTNVATNTPVLLLINGTFQQVYLGPADSAGTGNRALAVPN